jgi:hypothetical protein
MLQGWWWNGRGGVCPFSKLDADVGEMCALRWYGRRREEAYDQRYYLLIKTGNKRKKILFRS